MAQVRGRDLIDAVLFVRQAHGRDAHDRVLEALGNDVPDAFRSELREPSWYPLDALTAYLRAAQRRLAPDNPRFFREQGFFAARREKATFLGPMVATAENRARLAPTAWRLFYDTGRLEVIGEPSGEERGRVHDFPTTPELCERFCGIWEGMASTAAQRARAQHPRCVLRGDPYCDFLVVYEPVGP